MKRAIIQENQFEPGDKVRYVGSNHFALNGEVATVIGWHNKTTEEIKIQFEDGTLYGAFPENLSLIKRKQP